MIEPTEVNIMGDIVEPIIIIVPFIINIFLYHYWKYRAKKAMKRDKIDYWIVSYDRCEFSMFMFGLLWLPGTVMMILSLKFDKEY
jgi:hypothetical protein